MRPRNYIEAVRGGRVRRIALASAFLFGIVTVGLAGAGRSAHGAGAAGGGSTLLPTQFGVGPATLAVRIEGPADGLHGRGVKVQPPLATALLVALASIAFALGYWSTRHLDVAARLRLLFRRAPQRAPPSFLLAHP